MRFLCPSCQGQSQWCCHVGVSTLYCPAERVVLLYTVSPCRSSLLWLLVFLWCGALLGQGLVSLARLKAPSSLQCSARSGIMSQREWQMCVRGDEELGEGLGVLFMYVQQDAYVCTCMFSLMHTGMCTHTHTHTCIIPAIYDVVCIAIIQE